MVANNLGEERMLTDGSGVMEDAFAQAEADVGTAARSVAALARELRKARSAAASGQVRELRRALDAAVQAADEVAQAVASARGGYDVDEGELLASGDYAAELLSCATQAGVAMFAEDDRLLCYPSIVRVLPSELALEVDRRRVRGLRPSVVVAALQRAQNAGPRFKPEPFLASLLAAYDLELARQGKSPGAVVRLVDVYSILTLLPNQAREYSKPEFTRDLYLLDQSGVTAVGSTRRSLRWAASSGTRQAGVLSTVARSGQQQRYWGIAFEQSS